MWLIEAGLIATILTIIILTAAILIAAVLIAFIKWVAVARKYIKSLKDFYKSKYILLYLIASI